MLSNSQKYTVSGILTFLTVATTAGITPRSEGTPAQIADPVAVVEDMENRDRVFYRNGETKTIAPEAVPVTPEWPSSAEIDPGVAREEIPPVILEPVETPEPEPLSEEELLIPKTGNHAAAQPLLEETADVSGISVPLVASAFVIGLVVLGAILFGIMRLLRRFRPTLSREATAPPPIAAVGTETSLPRLETAMGVKAGENAVC